MIRSGWIALVAVLALGACRGGEDGGDVQAAASGRPSLLSRIAGGERSQDFAAIPKGEWNDLTRQLTEASDLDAAIAATREILARGGIATRDGERELVAAHAPAASFSVTPREVENMAMEARARGVRARLEVAEFAHMLASFGWDFPNAQRSGNASQPDSDIEDEYTQQRRREMLKEEAKSRHAAREAEEAEHEAWVDSVMDAPNARHEAARAQVDAANQAVRQAPTREVKQALYPQVQAARDELAAAREAAGAARDIVREGQKTRQAKQDATRQVDEFEAFYQRKVGPEYGAGEDFQLALERWVQSAAKAPEDPASFAPLFITEMVRLQDPPVDLADPQRRALGRPGSDLPVKGAGPRSGQTRLTLLEMQLILGAFDRHAAKGTDKALAIAFKDAIDGKPKQVSEAVAAAGRVLRIASSLPGKPIDLEVEPVEVHRPEEEGMRVAFTAAAEGAKDEAARLHWQLVSGAPVHALWTLRNNDFQLEGSSRQSGEAGDDYVVDIKTESGHRGTEARGYVTAVAKRGFQRSAQELIADMDPGAGPDTNRGFQRSAEELARDAGWLEETSMPRAYASVEVSYHCANPTTIHLYVTDPVADGRGDGGDACTFTFATREAFEDWRDANGY
ncbi:MAG: hypothetical protein M3Y70_03680 [Pseudomonadota bacterium]|nr:hypothetical protein [Pseudomonadota bacterium]